MRLLQGRDGDGQAASTESGSGRLKAARLGTQKPVPISRRVVSVDQSITIRDSGASPRAAIYLFRR